MRDDLSVTESRVLRRHEDSLVEGTRDVIGLYFICSDLGVNFHPTEPLNPAEEELFLHDLWVLLRTGLLVPIAFPDPGSEPMPVHEGPEAVYESIVADWHSDPKEAEISWWFRVDPDAVGLLKRYIEFD